MKSPDEGDLAARREPLWRSVRSALSEDIAEGRYRVGDRLPSEAALATRFGVNRHTLRRALADLQEEGVLHIKRGAGATVMSTRIDNRLGARTRFTENLMSAHRTPGRQLLRLETAVATLAEARALDLEEGAPVHLVEALGEADGTPVVYSRSAFPAERLPGLLEALRARRSITGALEAEGVGDYHRRWTRLTAEAASPLIARRLAAPEDAALLRTESVDVAIDGAPITHAHAWFHTARIAVFVGEEERRWADGGRLDAATGGAG